MEIDFIRVSSSHQNIECQMLKYSILFKQKVDFDIFPMLKSMENAVHAIKSSASSSNILRMIAGSMAKKRIGGMLDLLFLTELNDELGAHLFSSVQDSYDSQYTQKASSR